MAAAANLGIVQNDIFTVLGERANSPSINRSFKTAVREQLDAGRTAVLELFLDRSPRRSMISSLASSTSYSSSASARKRTTTPPASTGSDGIKSRMIPTPKGKTDELLRRSRAKSDVGLTFLKHFAEIDLDPLQSLTLSFVNAQCPSQNQRNLRSGCLDFSIGQLDFPGLSLTQEIASRPILGHKADQRI